MKDNPKKNLKDHPSHTFIFFFGLLSTLSNLSFFKLMKIIHQISRTDKVFGLTCLKKLKN